MVEHGNKYPKLNSKLYSQVSGSMVAVDAIPPGPKLDAVNVNQYTKWCTKGTGQASEPLSR